MENMQDTVNIDEFKLQEYYENLLDIQYLPILLEKWQGYIEFLTKKLMEKNLNVKIFRFKKDLKIVDHNDFVTHLYDLTFWHYLDISKNA